MNAHVSDKREILQAQRRRNDNFASILTLERQNYGIFLNFRCLFSFRGDRPKLKQIRLQFSGKFLSNSLRHTSHSTEKILR